MAKRAIFSMEAIYPKEPFSSNRVRAYVLNALKDEAKIIKKHLDLTVENWLHKPTFNDKILYGSPTTASGMLMDVKDPRIYAYPMGTYKAVSEWTFVNNGTRVRYIGFKKGYVPMTHVPGSFGNNRPRWNTYMTSYRIHNDKKPRPGIKARNWTGILQRYRQPIFKKKIDEAIRKGLEPK